MTQFDIEEELEELSSAEDFLNYFGIEFEPSVVQVNRLHIMQRFHDYLEKAQSGIDLTKSDAEVRAIYHRLLEQSYADFVTSDAMTEKVFKVFRMHEPQTGFVPLDQLLGQ